MRKAIFLLVACLFSGLLVYGQTKITLKLNNVSLKYAIDTLEKLTPSQDFQFNPRLIQGFNNITINVTGASLDVVLKDLFAALPINYEIGRRRIFLAKKETVEEITLSGKVIDENREPIPNATVAVKGAGKATFTDSSGNFRLNNVNKKSTLIISFVGYKEKEVDIEGRDRVTAQLISNQTELEQVTVYDGYQTKDRERAPGSFVKIDNPTLNRNTSFKILDRLEGVTSGLAVNTSQVLGSNQPKRSIRGISTINAYSEPLVIVDNFPYEGNLDNINPNDIENITIARDAAAASIWGAFAGNGVIVITTKKGKFDQPVKVTVNSILTPGGKPDLSYVPVLNSRDYVAVEEFLFEQGHYDPTLLSSQYRAVSPVVEILDKLRRTLISPAAAEEQLEMLRMHNTLNDREKYFYRNIFNQQYAISLTGGTKTIRNYLSFGFDQNIGNLRRNKTDRITITGNNSYKLLKEKLELSTGIVFTQSRIDNNNTGIFAPQYPYLPLADAFGNKLPVAQDYRSSYTDTAGGGNLLDWKYNPIDEMLLADNSAKRTHYRVNVGLDYKLFPTLHLLVNYQFSNEIYEQDDFKDVATYYTRNLVNTYTRINYNTGVVSRPVPVGGILDRNRYTNSAHNIRAQAKYSAIFKEDHELTAIAGTETRIIETQTNSNRLYGYDKASQSSREVDYQSSFPIYYSPLDTQRIPDNIFNLGTTDHYFSLFSNAAYTYKQRYTISVSARRDQSNLFGASTNNKLIPLWSIGASWIISKDVNIDFLDQLRLRATHGYTGNIDKTVSAYVTAKIGTALIPPFNAIQATIVNPPNKNLTWEKIRMTNFAVDFATRKNILTGSIEYYFKEGSNLIGYTDVDPTTGVSQYRGNSAGIKGKGFDIILNAKIIDRAFGWKAILLLSHTTDKVTSYTGGPENISSYADQPFFNPLEGKPLYSIYSYRWAGLNAEGDPVGSTMGHDTTTDYHNILFSRDFNDLVYNGPATPTTFGSLRNTFSWKNLELSVNVVFKTGYYFKRSTIDYEELYRGAPGHPDYNKRWQNPGDETRTTVPRQPYPANPERESFYTNSSILVEKGDHIRLQDVLLSYTASKLKIGKLAVPARFSLYVNNIGILWKATKTHYDPDFILDNLPNPLTVSAGLSFTF